MTQAVNISGLSEEEVAALKVRCLFLSLQHHLSLLLPNTLVAEVIDYRPIDEAAQLPEWVTGMLSWRGRNVPLISFERLLGKDQAKRGSNTRYVIFNTIRKDSRIPFIAMAIEGLPHLAMVEQTQLAYDSDAAERQPAVLARLRYRDQSVIVPNLDVIERMLEHLGVSAA